MSQEARCRELLAGFHLGNLTTEEVRELQERSKSEAALLRMIGHDFLLDRLLRHALMEDVTADDFAKRVQDRLRGHYQDESKQKMRFRGGLSMVAALMLVSITLWATFYHSGDERMIHSAIMRLDSEVNEEREEAERTLIAFGIKAEPALEEAASSRETRLATRATSVLRTFRRIQEEKAWDERVKALPQTAGTRQVKQGVEMTLKSGLEGSNLVLTDDAFLTLGGERKPLATVKTVCSADHLLRPREFTVDLTDPGTGKKTSYAGTLKDGTVKMKGSQNETLEVTNKTITSPTLYRLLWTLPGKAGFELEFDLLVLNAQAQFWPNQKLKCIGEEEVDLGGKKVKAWKWEWDRRIPEMADVYAVEHYWVAGGKLVKVTSATRPGKAFLASEE